jgi:5-methyltetrahydrofolate--homocysteine methyltransferase
MQVVYDESPAEMARGVVPLLHAGASILGACCGSTPEHIRAFRQAMDDYARREVPQRVSPVLKMHHHRHQVSTRVGE